MLQRGLDPRKIVDLEGLTPLHHAAQNGHVAVIEVLVSRGLEIDAVDNTSMTALMAACAQGCAGAVRTLVRLGANTGLANSDGMTADKIAIAQGQLECLEALKPAPEEAEAAPKAEEAPKADDVEPSAAEEEATDPAAAPSEE